MFGPKLPQGIVPAGRSIGLILDSLGSVHVMDPRRLDAGKEPRDDPIDDPLRFRIALEMVYDPANGQMTGAELREAIEHRVETERRALDAIAEGE